jgi:hypothetical protein
MVPVPPQDIPLPLLWTRNFFFFIKIIIYLFLGFHEERKSCRRSLLTQKRTSRTLKH